MSEFKFGIFLYLKNSIVVKINVKVVLKYFKFIFFPPIFFLMVYANVL